jgi:hypothetical protein
VLAASALVVVAALAVLTLFFGHQARSLLSFRKVDDYPLYVMHLYEDSGQGYSRQAETQANRGPPAVASGSTPHWACTVFAALNGQGDRLLGRNFDWYNRPTLLLFTHPPSGFDAVSMVDVSYLGFEGDEPSWSDRLRLLEASRWPFDGMNEHGLAVGMMAVPHAEDRAQAGQTTISSLYAMRLLLDRARTVDEAIALLQDYHIDFGDGPPLHYLIADATGRSAILEFIQGEMVLHYSRAPWQVATNFIVSGHSSESASSQCWRYALAEARLQSTGGQLSQAEAMALLQAVSQRITMWSVVYNLTAGKISVSMGRDFDRVLLFQIPMQDTIDRSKGRTMPP